MAKLSPIFNAQTFDANGAPAVGYKLFTYAVGSSAKQTTFSDEAGAVPNSNPIILNADGWPTQGPIWLTEGLSYKFVLALPGDSDPPTSPVKTIDDVTGVGDSSVSISQWQPSGVTPTYTGINTFTLSGDQTSEFQVGRRLQFSVSAGAVYGRIRSSVFTTLTEVTMLMDDGMELDNGLSTANLSLLKASPSALPATGYAATSLNGGQLAGFRNLIINGNFAINQRAYVSGTAITGANQYTLDRWRVVTSGQSLTYSASGNGNQITAPAGGVEQVIEGANIGGGTYTLSWTGTATATVNGVACANGGNVALPTNINATVRFIGGTVSLVQFELGEIATPFEQRSIGIELVLSKRYCQTLMLDFRTYATGNFVYASPHCLPVTMRATPTATFISNIAASNTSSVTASPLSSVVVRYSILASGVGDSYRQDNYLFSAEL